MNILIAIFGIDIIAKRNYVEHNLSYFMLKDKRV